MNKKFSEQEMKFISNVTNELKEKAQELEKYAENNDILGIKLLTIRLGVLLDYLNDFVEEKKKEAMVYEQKV
jgi:hypothetical protein